MIRVPNKDYAFIKEDSEIRKAIENGLVWVGQKFLMNGNFITCIDITEDKYIFTLDNIFATDSWDNIEPRLENLYQTGYLSGIPLFTKDFINDIDFFFIPTEKQMFGENNFGEKENDNVKQFQLYKEYGDIARVKAIDKNIHEDYEKGETWHYWLSNQYKSNSTHCCYVYNIGLADYANASYTYVGVPIFFQMTKRS
jgi:hypothetical protein